MKGFAGLFALALLLVLGGGQAKSAEPQTFIVYGCGRIVAVNLCGLVPETGEVRELTSDGTAGRPYFAQSLSPDGRLLSFSFGREPYLASQNVGGRRRLGHFANVLHTSLRPDRRRIALGAIEGKCPPRGRDRCLTERAMLKVVTPIGTRLRRIPNVSDADWAGRFLIASINRGLWVLSDRPSEAPRRLAAFPHLILREPAVSPDRKRIALGVGRADGVDYLAVFSREDHKVRRLTSGPRDSSPEWSPDGMSIVFRRGRDLYVVPSDGHSRPSNLGVSGDNPTWGMRIAE